MEVALVIQLEHLLAFVPSILAWCLFPRAEKLAEHCAAHGQLVFLCLG